MTRPVLLILGLAFLAALTSALLFHLHSDVPGALAGAAVEPDYYLEDFSTLNLNADGEPENRLQAVYLAHYEDDDTSEMLKPRVQIFRPGRRPVFIEADKGWVTSNNDVILLEGGVQLWENDGQGRRALQVDTSDVRVLLADRYAETDQHTTISARRFTIAGRGLRAHLDNNRLEILNHERTTIAPKPAD